MCYDILVSDVEERKERPWGRKGNKNKGKDNRSGGSRKSDTAR